MISSRQTIYILLTLVVALGTLLRLYDLDEESIWLDEGVSIQASSARPMTIIQQTAVRESYPPLYYLLLHFWMEIFGSGVVAVRALSVLFGVAALPLIYLLGRALYDRWVGLFSAFFLAVSPFHVYYSQEGRMYALFTLLSLASAYALMELLVKKERRHFVAYVLFTALCLYTYYYSYFLLLFENLLVLWVILREEQNRVSWKDWALAQALVFGLYLPWLWISLSQDTPIGWIPSTPATLEALWKYLSLTLYRFLHVAGTTAMPIKASTAELRQVLWVVGLLAVFNLVSSKVREDSSADLRPDTKLLFGFGYLFLIPVMAFLVSAFVRPIYLTRALIVCVPPLCLMEANGAVTGAKALAKLARFPSLLAKAAIAVVSLLLLVAGTYWWALTTGSLKHIYNIVQKEQWREAVDFIQKQGQEEDLIAITPGYARAPFDYYYRGPWEEVAVTGDEPIILEPLLKKYRRLWLVSRFSEGTERWLGYERAHPVQTKEWFGVKVILYNIPWE